MKDTRPVKCVFCGKKMYYIDHKKHEEECEIFVVQGRPSNHFYAHMKCLPNNLREEKS